MWSGDSIHIKDVLATRCPGDNAQLLLVMLENVSLCLKGARGQQPVGWMQWHTAPTPLSASESLSRSARTSASIGVRDGGKCASECRGALRTDHRQASGVSRMRVRIVPHQARLEHF